MAKQEKEQIRHLQRLLTELGMKGSPTIGKAKALKEKRELAAELSQSFNLTNLCPISSE